MARILLQAVVAAAFVLVGYFIILILVTVLVAVGAALNPVAFAPSVANMQSAWSYIGQSSLAAWTVVYAALILACFAVLLMWRGLRRVWR